MSLNPNLLLDHNNFFFYFYYFVEHPSVPSGLHPFNTEEGRYFSKSLNTYNAAPSMQSPCNNLLSAAALIEILF